MKWSSPLTDGQILGVMSDEGRGLYRGCYWGEETRHGVLDVDTNSRYHNALELGELVRRFAAVGLTLTPYQSSDSGGWHLYFFLNDWAKSADVEKTIKDFLKVHRYEIKGGTLEVFPSGNALRLPLQRGFAWLAPDGKVKVRREEITRDEALASFLTDYQNNAGNWEITKLLIESQKLSAGSAGDAGAQDDRDPQINEGFEGLFRSGLDWEKYQRGREYWLNGLSDWSQRHDAILCVGHYLWYGDKSAGVWPLPYGRNAEARAQRIKAWLEGKHNGRSRAVNRGQWTDISGDIERAAKWTSQAALTREYEPYPLTERLLKRLHWLYEKTGRLWTVEELAKANINRSLDARQRIALAVAQLEAEDSEIDITKVARRAKACHKTVAKNRDLLFSPGSVNSGGSGGLVRQLGILEASEGSPGTSHLTTESMSKLFDNAAVSEKEEKNLPVSLVGGSEAARGLVNSSSEEKSFTPQPAAVVAGPSPLVLVCDMAGAGPQDFTVAPLFHAWLKSLPESAQNQDRALRVATQVLTLGPTDPGIQASGHGTAGGLFLCLSSGAALLDLVWPVEPADADGLPIACGSGSVMGSLRAVPEPGGADPAKPQERRISAGLGGGSRGPP